MASTSSLISLSWISRIGSQSFPHLRCWGRVLHRMTGRHPLGSRLGHASNRGICLPRLCYDSNLPGELARVCVETTSRSAGCAAMSRPFSTAVSKPPLDRGQIVRLSWIPSRGRFMSTERSSGEGNDDKKQQNIGPESKTARLLSRLPLPVHENIYTIPNILTFSRLAAAPVIGYCILHSYDTLALSLFAYASITDLVDGYIARKFNQKTVVGTVIDPMADKTLMTIGVICLAVKSAIPVWLAALILARDVGLAISAIYYRWISLPQPKTMARYWDFSLPSAEVKPTAISKVNTALQLLLIGSAMAIPVVPEAILTAWHLHEGMTGLQYIVAGTTIWSGASYIYSKDAVRILTSEEIETRLALKQKEEEEKIEKK
ncbi:phosphatidyl synthase [Paracoccidioides lutzii Pb01]|uniref:Phosphatidyl synthase n=1 Tax=Paracoccidioides lutzii (strain ATCC MYA-826 / Pb01) TaxID=502779 RepID=C1GXJ7_PARBA|nr:phosphatidyl synthase [Paracoccidioides lutzii Pb01]EEH41285.2 phosphatidyl synthase [Paracoccidioides lutzii Pb01]